MAVEDSYLASLINVRARLLAVKRVLNPKAPCGILWINCVFVWIFNYTKAKTVSAFLFLKSHAVPLGCPYSLKELLGGAMATGDYLSLLLLFTQNGNAIIDHAQFEHLAELGIVRFIENGIELINNETTLPIDCQSTATVDWQSIEPNDRQKHILEFMASNGSVTTAQLAKITGLTQGRVRTILQDYGKRFCGERRRLSLHNVQIKKNIN